VLTEGSKKSFDFVDHRDCSLNALGWIRPSIRAIRVRRVLQAGARQ